MNIVNFRGYKVSKCEFVNECENGAKIEFANSFSYNVKYNNSDVCFGEIAFEARDKTRGDKFHINVTLTGIFKYDKSAEKEKVHVESFRELFPFLRSFIAGLTTSCGIPPVYIPPCDIENKCIYKIEKNI